MRICVYEDRHIRGLEPLSLTHPVADLICGLTPLSAKHARYFGAGRVGHLCRGDVAELIQARDPQSPVNDPAWLRNAPTVLVNARWVPPLKTADLVFTRPHLARVGDEIAYAVLDTPHLQAVSPNRIDECLDDWRQSLPSWEVGGIVVRHLWDLVELNAVQLAQDFPVVADSTRAGYHPTGFERVGPPERLFIHPTARIDPFVMADTTNGPVAIGPGAVIQAFTRLEGPCGVGAGAVVLGAKVRAGTTIGPNCRVGGEVECSILMGHVNKYHEGFLGHSYVGEWVNLAAGTHTSDLRSDYQPVTVPMGGGEVSTGQIKAGAIIGDHAKTGLGVLLNCGTTIGPFAQVLPGAGFAPREVPAFHRSSPNGIKELNDVDRLLTTADVMMRRRGKQLTPALEAIYRAVATRKEDASLPVLPLRRVG